MVGRTIAHYRIVRELGAGGMGVVFAAEDLRLGRQVAIKFVPDAMSDDKQLFERLRSEARTASSLNHPNICILHDVGDHDGRPFIVMELLQGKTLRERLSAVPLKVHDTLDIGIQAADALDAAHRQHVIHRDIKPANLFLTDRGLVKILDFGLAKIVAHQPSALTAAPTGLTTAGMTLGTVSYMSPEQVTGDSLDGRSDLFSFGVVLYECVTGHQPFKGKTSGMILSEILTRTPAAPLVLNPDMPLRLQEIITNCLEKDRELRYQDAAALRTDLKRLKRDLESGPRSASRIGIPVEESSQPVADPSVRATPTLATPSAAAPARASSPIAYAVAAAIATAVLVAVVWGVYALRATDARQQDGAPVASVERSVSAPSADPALAAPAPRDANPPAAPAAAPRVAAPAPERRQESARVSPPALAATPGIAPPSFAEIPIPPAPLAAPTLPPPPVVPPTDAPRTAPAPASSQQPAVASPAADDDDAAIRRVVAAYARAIETKDLEAFRSVKPDLSGAEQRRLEDSFKAIASQRVDITVLSIEHRASSALVKVRRRDTLTAGGRAQTSDSQQTMTLIRSGAGWVISEIGR